MDDVRTLRFEHEQRGKAQLDMIARVLDVLFAPIDYLKTRREAEMSPKERVVGAIGAISATRAIIPPNET